MNPNHFSVRLKVNTINFGTTLKMEVSHKYFFIYRSYENGIVKINFNNLKIQSIDQGLNITFQISISSVIYVSSDLSQMQFVIRLNQFPTIFLKKGEKYEETDLFDFEYSLFMNYYLRKPSIMIQFNSIENAQSFCDLLSTYLTSTKRKQDYFIYQMAYDYFYSIEKYFQKNLYKISFNSQYLVLCLLSSDRKSVV